MSNGVSMPRSDRTLHTASETPSARKVWVMLRTPSVSRDPVTDEGNVTSPEDRIALRENHGSTGLRRTGQLPSQKGQPKARVGNGCSRPGARTPTQANR